HYLLHAGRQQIEIAYRGIRLGAVNRRKVEAVVTTALVTPVAAHRLVALGFRPRVRADIAQSARTYYSIDATETEQVKVGFDIVGALVDEMQRSPNLVLSESRKPFA